TTPSERGGLGTSRTWPSTANDRCGRRAHRANSLRLKSRSPWRSRDRRRSSSHGGIIGQWLGSTDGVLLFVRDCRIYLSTSGSLGRDAETAVITSGTGPPTTRTALPLRIGPTSTERVRAAVSRVLSRRCRGIIRHGRLMVLSPFL